MEKTEIKIEKELQIKYAMSYMPDDPPRTINGKDIPLSDVKKELIKQIDTE